MFMKNKLLILFLSIILSQQFSWSDTLEAQREELKKILTLRLQYENLKNIREIYEKELNVLKLQYERNKQIADFQKNQPEEQIKTPIYTTAFTLMPAAEWEETFIQYAKDIKLTKIVRGTNTDLIFTFPNMSNRIKNLLDNYNTAIPVVTVNSVLLSSGKLLQFDQIISSKLDEQSILVATEGSSILKINLSMSYILPVEKNPKTILSREHPQKNEMTLLPSFKSDVIIELDADKANSIVQIDAVDVQGNNLATKVTEKISNANDLTTQLIRIQLLENFIQALDDKKIQNSKDALDFFLANSDEYLVAANQSIRHVTKSFAGNIEQVVVYTIDGTVEKKYNFSIYP